MALMFHGLNTTSTYDDEGEMDEEGEDTNSAMIRNECMAEFNRFKQNSVSIPLYTTDGSLGDPLEWWKKNQLKYLYLAGLLVYILQCRQYLLHRKVFGVGCQEF